MSFTCSCSLAFTVRQIARALLGLFAALLLAAPPARGADVSNGEQIYATICATCHGTDPRLNENNIRRAANNPSLIAAAINSLVPSMAFLRGVLSTTQIEDVAAYIGGVVNPTTGTPILNASTTTMNFGSIAVGSTSPGQSLTLANTGTGALVLSGITITPPDFVIFSGCPGTINAGGMCFISVQFAPRAAGEISGSLTISSNAATSPLVVALSGVGAGGTSTAPTVVEYYAPELNHYFIAGSLAEQAFVDSGGAGRWLRTGNSFPSGGSVQVCRFYGNTAINPATGQMYGPNSHFYTADAGECAFLKSLFDPNAASLQFEGNDFNTTPASNGACASGLTPVYRAYNNGFSRGILSNHRITSNLAAYQQTVAEGWIGEGVVMCAP
ncbi:MAG: choice-of-anchor D domain-containing protein [Betaproteobacteria bacterium]|nr:choice-of-anchor D domain-containing protein [Betaproteobacteria bacterium]